MTRELSIVPRLIFTNPLLNKFFFGEARGWWVAATYLQKQSYRENVWDNQEHRGYTKWIGWMAWMWDSGRIKRG